MEQPRRISVLRNFENAVETYNQEAELQQTYALELAKLCSQEVIKTGLWVDLGSGTGFLAEALEALNPDQAVMRLDWSPKMLDQHSSKRKTQLWDLNKGLPEWTEAPNLIASNFALQWLNNAEDRVLEWFQALAPKGLLALAVPVQGSFPEWYKAAVSSGVLCTAKPLPSSKSLLKRLSPHHIRYQRLHSFTQQADEVISLLKPMIKVGAQGSPYRSLTAVEWRKLKAAWPRSTTCKGVKLTWLIQVLLVQR